MVRITQAKVTQANLFRTRNKNTWWHPFLEGMMIAVKFFTNELEVNVMPAKKHITKGIISSLSILFIKNMFPVYTVQIGIKAIQVSLRKIPSFNIFSLIFGFCQFFQMDNREMIRQPWCVIMTDSSSDEIALVII